MPDRQFLGNGHTGRLKAFTTEELGTLAWGLSLLPSDDGPRDALFYEVLDEQRARDSLERHRTSRQDPYDNG